MTVLRLFCLGVLLSILLMGCSISPAPMTLPPLTLGTEQHPLELSGLVKEDLQVGGVILIVADLRIPKGRSLYIAAGSKVRVLGNDSTKVDPEYLDKGTEILVLGTLVITGTPTAPVKFSLDEETPEGENWSGIELEHAERAVLEYVDILGAETGILSIDSSPQLVQVNILGSRYGLLMQGAGRLNYAGGRISGGDAGLLCFDQAALELTQVQIVDNFEEGLYLNRDCTLQTQDLLISRNDIGVVASAAQHQQLSPQVSNNRIDFKTLSAGGVQ